MTENLHAGHRQRLRNRAAAEGLSAFEPHQVMEWLLFYVIPRRDTSDIAHRLILRFGSVQGVLNAGIQELVSVEGVGKRTAEWLAAVGELVDAYAALQSADRPAITNRQSAFRFCVEKRKHVLPPRTVQLSLSVNGNVLRCDELCDSLSWGETQPLRTGLLSALSMQAQVVIVVLFCDEADPVPGDYDCDSASDYAYLLEAAGLQLLDVILVGSDRMTSMVHEGLLRQPEDNDHAAVLSERYLREESADFPYDVLFPDDDPA